MKFPARLILILLISYFLSLFSPVVHAQVVSSYPAPNTNPNVPNNLHNWTQNVMIEVMSALTCQLVGVDPTNPHQACLGVDQKSGKIGFVENGGGAVGVMGNMISMLYTPPVHTADYFRNLASNFGFTKHAYAQNSKTGFDSLSPLLPIWTAFRNIVYLIFVIVFVVIGLAVMFRIKIDPRTVMSIQNQIPKIIIGLLVITFSFAIAGFLVDFMWILIYLVYGVISGIPSIDVANLNPAIIQGQTALGVGGAIGGIRGIGGVAGISNGVAANIVNIISSFLAFNDPKSFMSITTDIISGVIGGITALIVSGQNWQLAGFTIPTGPAAGIVIGAGAGVTAKETLVNFIPYAIAFLIVFIAILFALFRLWFTLIMAYISILLDVALAPLWIIAGLIPGSSISFTGWLRDLGANLLAFPTTIAMFLLGKVMMQAFGTTQTGGQFVPPLIGNPAATNAIGSLIGLGFILLTPNVVNMVKAALKAPKTDVGSIGKAIGVATGAPSGIFNRVGQIGLSLSGARNLPLVGRLPGIKAREGAQGAGGGGAGGATH